MSLVQTVLELQAMSLLPCISMMIIMPMHVSCCRWTETCKGARDGICQCCNIDKEMISWYLSVNSLFEAVQFSQAISVANQIL